MKAADRINLICETFNTNPKRLAEEMGYDSPSTLYMVVNGHTKDLSPKMVTGLEKLYPTLSKDFLIGLSDNPIKEIESLSPSTAALILGELAEIKKMLQILMNDKAPKR